MKTAAQLADMTETAFEAYLKRKGIRGLAAVNVSSKRRAELRRRADTDCLRDLDALADMVDAGQDGHETQP